MIDYSNPSPETDAFMLSIDDSDINMSLVRAKLHDMEIERDHAVAALKKLDRIYREDLDEPGSRPDWLQSIIDLKIRKSNG